MVTDIKFTKPRNGKPDSKVIAEGTMVIHGKILLPFRLIEGKSGLFVGYMSQKIDGEWVPQVNIIDRDWRIQIEEVVLKAWEDR